MADYEPDDVTDEVADYGSDDVTDEVADYESDDEACIITREQQCVEGNDENLQSLRHQQI